MRVLELFLTIFNLAKTQSAFLALAPSSVIDCYQFSLISHGVHGHPQENSPGYPDIDFRNPERTMSQEWAKARDVKLVIKCVVKGYHACDFTVEYGEAFVAT